MNYRNKFIKVFVNEMYAILIGIGIGNVLFASEFNFQDIRSVISLLFVTSIVLTYWWDWTEYVEGDVSNSKREMALDFAVLITLEMLFAYYSSMYSIAFILLAISVLDLFWVLNHLYETKLYKGDKRELKRTVTWLFEKILGIAIYGVLIVIVKYTIEYAPKNFVNYMTLAEVMITFVIVRKLSFNQIHKVNVSQVKLADLRHLDDILSINHSYFEGENQGLLLKKYTQSEIFSLIQDKKLYIATDFEDVVLGYSTINNKIDDEILKCTKPILNETYHQLIGKECVYIEQIAIMKKLERNGIATYILKHIFEVNPKKFITSYVAVEPFENVGSLKFHLNNGFKKTGIFSANHFDGRDNYLSYLLVREPHENSM